MEKRERKMQLQGDEEAWDFDPPTEKLLPRPAGPRARASLRTPFPPAASNEDERKGGKAQTSLRRLRRRRRRKERAALCWPHAIGHSCPPEAWASGSPEGAGAFAAELKWRAAKKRKKQRPPAWGWS